jgi:hypothetical protein
MAAAAASTDTASIVVLFILAGVAGFFTLPRNERLIQRLLDAMV